MTTFKRSNVTDQLSQIERDNAEFQQDVRNQLVALQMLVAGAMNELRRTNNALERTFSEVADVKKKSSN